MPPSTRPSTRRKRQPVWARYDDDRLLGLRLCDLKLTIPGTSLEPRLDRLRADLDRKGLACFRPHAWLSSEWFSPDGVPGIAAPFYLAHPRLMRLEQKQMLQVEGGSEAECMRILRHEAGHAIDAAYRLHRRKRWRELFGSFTQPYPDSYQPKPGSRRYVQHLPFWYAQAHPAEDFAETFAVWLTPGQSWQQRYATWPTALRKLEYVNELMREIADQPPPVRTRRQVEPLRQCRKTLREHYRDRKLHYADEWPDFFDIDLRRLFSTDPRFAGRPTAASFLRRVRPDLRRIVADWTGTHPYTIDQVLADMIDRCKELRLRLALPESQARSQAMIMVTVQTMHYMHAGHHRLAL